MLIEIWISIISKSSAIENLTTCGYAVGVNLVAQKKFSMHLDVVFGARRLMTCLSWEILQQLD